MSVSRRALLFATIRFYLPNLPIYIPLLRYICSALLYLYGLYFLDSPLLSRIEFDTTIYLTLFAVAVISYIVAWCSNPGIVLITFKIPQLVNDRPTSVIPVVVSMISTVNSRNNANDNLLPSLELESDLSLVRMDSDESVLSEHAQLLVNTDYNITGSAHLTFPNFPPVSASEQRYAESIQRMVNVVAAAAEAEAGAVCNGFVQSSQDVVDANKSFVDKDSIVIPIAGENQEHLCTVCQQTRPPRSKHCYEIGRCVAKFDHYCPFLDNAIGGFNHRYFLLFLAIHTVLLSWSCIECLNIFTDITATQWVVRSVYATFLVGMTIGILCLFGFHSWLALMNVTTYEYIKADMTNPRPFAKFDQGILTNLLSFFRGAVKDEWLFAVSQVEPCQ